MLLEKQFVVFHSFGCQHEFSMVKCQETQQIQVKLGCVGTIAVTPQALIHSNSSIQVLMAVSEEIHLFTIQMRNLPCRREIRKANKSVLKQLLIMLYSCGRAGCHGKVGRLWLIFAGLFSVSCGLAGESEVFFKMKFSHLKISPSSACLSSLTTPTHQPN